MIIQDVPYIEDKKEKFASCQGPPSVLMTFKYFLPDERMTFQRLYSEMDYIHATWFFETYISILFHKYNIFSKYYSSRDIKKIGNSEETFKEITGLSKFSVEEQDAVGIAHYDSSIDYVKKNNLFEVRKIDFDFIKSNLDDGKLVIATLNRNSLLDLPGYKAHFLVLKGYDDMNFISNDAYLGENFKIKFEDFDKAFYQVTFDKNGNKIIIADLVVVGSKLSS